MDTYLPDELDRKILQLIANDARISFLEVSRICNVSGAAVHQRVQKMIANKIITGSEFRLNMPRIGYKTCAFVRLQLVHDADTDAASRLLLDIPEIAECHLIPGVSELLVKMYARDNEHLGNIIDSRLKPLGVRKAEITVSCRETFHRQPSVALL